MLAAGRPAGKVHRQFPAGGVTGSGWGSPPLRDPCLTLSDREPMMTFANRVFDKLKNLLGTQAKQEPQPESPPPRSSRASAAGQPPRRPARPRSPLSAPGLGAGRSRGASGAFEPLGPPEESAPAEIPCPNC